MTTAELILNDPFNINHGHVQPVRIALAARAAPGAKLDGNSTRSEELFVFLDNSRLSVNYRSGECRSWGHPNTDEYKSKFFC